MISRNYLLSQRSSSGRSVRACVRTCVCTCPLLTAHVPPPPAHYVSKGHPATSTSSNPALMRVDSLVGLSLSCSLTLLLPRINPVQIILSKHHPTTTRALPLPSTWNSAVPSTRIKRLSLFVQNFTKQMRTWNFTNKIPNISPTILEMCIYLCITSTEDLSSASVFVWNETNNVMPM